MVREVPQELVDMIIDSLYEITDKKQDLNNCALVCRTWVHRTRYNQLQVIHAFGSDEWKRWANLLQSQPYRKLVRSLSLSKPNAAQVCPLFPHFVNLRDLRLEYIDWDKVLPLPKYGALSALTSLENLTMDECMSGAPKRLWRFISAFPVLETVIAVNFDYCARVNEDISDFTEDELAEISACCPPLRDLTLSYNTVGSSEAELFRLVQFLPFAKDLTRLSVYWHVEGTEYLYELLQCCGGSLLSLELSFEWEAIGAAIDLEHNTGLQNLLISACNINVALLSLNSPDIETIVVYDPGNSGLATEGDWGLIDTHLRENSFGRLKQMSVSATADAVAVIFSKMPTLRERGVLSTTEELPPCFSDHKHVP